jgi:ribosomal-protein-alanine N-acetyltransferase
MWLGPFGAPRWRIGPAAPADAAAIAAIHEASFARGWSAADIEGMLADASIRGDILRAGPRREAVDGFALSRLVADEAEILSIAVRPRCRRKGGATALFGQHLGRLAADGARRIVLEVDEANMPARALYARFGFAHAGMRAAYYARSDGSRGNALLLAANLAGR